ncbi:hypothetical protein [Nioella nitratireducens]|uniref:hypothetical protein n=1 Tax=Nioella nitratireducens TaxID=1287720 RepID=UPI0008FD8486|nr:hypothetical protein [Nioella nitratireducens]
MRKLIAIINVISWAGFWAFGYLALTSDQPDSSQTLIALVLAAAGMLAGVWAYLKLSKGQQLPAPPKNTNRSEA